MNEVTPEARAAICAIRRCSMWRELHKVWDNAGDVDFGSLKIVDKSDLFGSRLRSPADLLVHGRLDRAVGIRISSGSSGGVRSWCCVSEADLGREAELLDGALSRLCGSQRGQSMLLLNMLPPGVHLQLPQVSTVTTGPNSSAVCDALATFAPHYDGLILVGSPWFLKRALEQAALAGIDLSMSNLHMVSGEDVLPEALRTYLARLAGCSPTRITSSLGMSEVGLHLFHETSETVALRRAVMNDTDAVARLCGVELEVAPCFMTYDTSRLFVEEVDQELILTSLESDRLQPMIRYNGHDRGGFVDRDQAAALVSRGELDSLSGPLVWVAGRAREPEVLTIGETMCRVGVGLRLMTGAFVHDRDEGVVDVQLTSGGYSTAERAALHERLEHELAKVYDPPPTLRLWCAARYPHGSLDLWSSKFRRSAP